MAHPLISTIVIALALAWVFGTAAHRLRLPPLVGYLLAGVLIGPATPGFVADQTLASELAEIGVILLMFGVGLHFSLEQLLSVRAIAVPGAIAQIACATLLGMALGHWLGWSLGAGLVFGLALSVASTVVLLRALQERRLVETGRGRIAVGWLIVEDMVMVLTLVLLPAFAGVLGGEGAANTDLAAVAKAGGLTIAKFAAFVAIMLIVGKRLIPWVLHYMAHTGSRELFRLAVFVIALGAAYAAAELFGVSFALGAFFAGMILSESPLSQRAAEETLPLRDAFAVIFFVSVGMLFKPAILIEDPLAVLATLAIILLGKSLAAFAIIRLFRYPASTALLVSVSLAQIGEFSFILAGLGVDLGLLPERGRNLILAGAILSILLNPLLFAGLDMLQAWRDKAKAEVKPVEPEEEGAAREPVRPTALNDHVVLVGHGRVGGVIRESLAEKKVPLLVIENDDERLAELKAQGIEAIAGNAADPEIIAAANLGAARCLLVAIPDAFEGGQVVEQARALSPKLSIIARAHSEAEVLHLKKHGASVVILSEHEMARAMVALVSTADA
jgi:CPA2 family monovalent cation:H+ antiporter-2